MHLSISIISLCSLIGSIDAFSIPARAVRYNANYDDLTGGNAVTGFAVPKPYKDLTYTTFGYGAPGPLFIQPSSSPNFAVSPALGVDPLATPEISSSYPDSRVTSFDAESIASGCYAATEQGLLAPAISCTIRYTGTKAVTGEQVTFDAVFEVTTLNLAGVAVGPQVLQKKAFPKQFRDITSLKPRVLTAALPAGALTAQMAFDDFVYTVYIKK